MNLCTIGSRTSYSSCTLFKYSSALIDFSFSSFFRFATDDEDDEEEDDEEDEENEEEDEEDEGG